jgi:hypothetical protein
MPTAREIFRLPLSIGSRELIKGVSDVPTLKQALALEESAKVPRQARVDQLRLRIAVLEVPEEVIETWKPHRLPAMLGVPDTPRPARKPRPVQVTTAEYREDGFVVETVKDQGPEPKVVKVPTCRAHGEPEKLPRETGARSSAYMTGRGAFAQGVPARDVPREYDVDQARDWTAGWEDTEELVRTSPEIVRPLIVETISPAMPPELEEALDILASVQAEDLVNEALAGSLNEPIPVNENPAPVNAPEPPVNEPTPVDPTSPEGSWSVSLVRAMASGDVRTAELLLGIESRRAFNAHALATALCSAMASQKPVRSPKEKEVSKSYSVDSLT